MTSAPPGPAAAAPAQEPVPVVPQAQADQVVAVADSAGGLGWRSFVERVRRRRPDLASVLEQGQLVTFGPEGVVVAYAPGTFFFDAANDGDNRALFGELLASHMNQAQVGFTVLARGGGEAPGGVAPTLAQERQLAQQNAWSQTQEAAHAHAHVRAAVDILGGEVRAIERAGDTEEAP